MPADSATNTVSSTKREIDDPSRTKSGYRLSVDKKWESVMKFGFRVFARPTKQVNAEDGGTHKSKYMEAAGA